MPNRLATKVLTGAVEIADNSRTNLQDMKLLSVLLGLLATSSLTLAGSFGGPAPFSDGSPLASGNDGIYQATARGQNISGIISFAYSNGAQTTFAPQNRWSFFTAGQVVSGETTAAIRGATIEGILDGSSVNLNENEDGQVQFPLVFVSSANSGNGTFTAKLDYSDANSEFKGDGILTPAPATVTQIAIVTQSSNVFGTGFISSTNVTISNGGGTFLPVSFQVRGVRTSTEPTVVSNATNAVPTTN